MYENPTRTFDDLLAREQIERYITLSCVSNPVGGDLVGNALWRGVRLKDILDEAGVQDGAEQVVSRSVDGWTCGSPLETITDGRDAMLAIAMNGEALPAQHGFPVRIVVPGLFGYVSATKWVTDIRLTRWDEFDAYWIPRGWSKEGPVKTMARIDTGRKVKKSDGAIAIGGVAWAVPRGISQVQVRFDEGEWLDAELGGRDGRLRGASGCIEPGIWRPVVTTLKRERLMATESHSPKNAPQSHRTVRRGTTALHSPSRLDCRLPTKRTAINYGVRQPLLRGLRSTRQMPP